MKNPKIRKLFLGFVVVTILMACKATSPSTEPPTNQEVPSATQASNPTATPNVEPTTASTVPPVAAPTRVFPTLPAAQPGPETLDLTKLPQDPIISDFTEIYNNKVIWKDPQGADQDASTLYSYRKQTAPTDAWYALLQDTNPFISSKIETFVLGQEFFTLSADLGCLKPTPERIPNYDPQDSFRSLIKAMTGTAKLTQAEVTLGDQVTDLYTLQAANLVPASQIVVRADQADAKGETTLNSSDTFPLLSDGGKFEEAKLYLARQGGYAARVELTFSKTASAQDAPFAKVGSKVTNTLVYELHPASAQDEPIALPAECAGLTSDTGGNTGGGAGGLSPLTIADIPRLDNATDIHEFSNSFSYNSVSSLQEAVDFYKTKLVEQGWNVESETVLSTLATLTFTRGDQYLSVQIVTSNGKLMISISLN
jgi:hypothetical protein